MPATGIDTLAPDQRAAVQLVLRQGLSYAELSEMLGMPEETIRARARGGLEALAPDLPAPARAGEIADWLLGQQSEKHAARTRELLLSDPAAHEWAATVAKPLRKVPGGESVPALPSKARANGKAQPRRRAGAAPAARPRPRSSRLGGALLIGGAVVIVAAVLAFVFLRGDDPEPAADTETPAAATAVADADRGRPPARRRRDAGPGGLEGARGPAAGADRREPDRVRARRPGHPAQRERRALLAVVPQRGRQGAARRRHLAQPVGENGQLASSGPSEDNIDDFPTWFQSYETAVITQDEKGAKEPGRVIVSGAPCPTPSRSSRAAACRGS